MEQANHHLQPASAASLWWLGQAGYILESEGLRIVIDPYLSDSGAGETGRFKRLFPPPIAPADLKADLILITHDHADHLDPETLGPYAHKATTWFVAPRFTAKRLAMLGIPANRIVVVDAGDTHDFNGTTITGVYALPTGIDVLDTTGYLVTFKNGRSVYHTSDTQCHPLVLAAAPGNPDIMLVPINGKWGNPGPEDAAKFAAAVQPRFVMPNHYDAMRLNTEDPESFRWFCEVNGLDKQCIILEHMKPFTWNTP